MLKLTDAMRLADELKYPDARGVFFDTRINGEIPSTCAIGGANLAARNITFEVAVSDEPYWRLTKGNIEDLLSFSDYFVYYCDSQLVGNPPDYIECPDCEKPNDLKMIIIHLYDDHLWTRTSIAKWLDAKVFK